MALQATLSRPLPRQSLRLSPKGCAGVARILYAADPALSFGLLQRASAADGPVDTAEKKRLLRVDPPGGSVVTIAQFVIPRCRGRVVSEKERVSLAIEPELLARFDRLIEGSGGNRSEAMRDLIRNRLIEADWVSTATGNAVATVTLVYDHSKRDLADRLLEVGHDNHHAVMASMHVHLDHDNCLEVIALRGAPKKLRAIADALIAMKGVKHGKVAMSSADP